MDYTKEELALMGEALVKNKVQCGLCSNAVILLEAYPNWEYGFYVCEECQ